MLWILAAVMLLVGIVTTVLMALATRGVDVDDLDSVSDRWIAEHRVDPL
jgi:hypothetical protein